MEGLEMQGLSAEPTYGAEIVGLSLLLIGYGVIMVIVANGVLAYYLGKFAKILVDELRQGWDDRMGNEGLQPAQQWLEATH